MKDRISKFLKSNIYAIAAFFLPVLVVVLAFAVTGIYPFGEQQIAVIDMYHQYVPFLGELQYKLQEGGNLFYSWNSGGGCNFWCLLSYYGASPLNLLLVLFPQSLLMEGVTTVLLIKFGLTGLFMFIFLKNAECSSDGALDREYGWHTVAFATTYALCSYMIGYYWCIMWLEGVMLLPLIMLGLSRLIREGKMTLYTVSLALAIFCNYYIAIMICIFIAVFYPVLYFINIKNGGMKACLLTTGKALGCSMLGILMAGAMMIPTYISMQDTYYFDAEMPTDWSFYAHALEVLNQLLPNAHLTYLDGLPNLCCSLLVTIMMAFYFVTKEIPIREKGLFGIILVFMFLSVNLNKLDFIWHGMHFPNQLPFRFSFIICFMLVALAYRAFKRVGSISSRAINITLGIGIAYYLFAQKFMSEKIDDPNVFFYYGAALLALYGTLIYMYKHYKITRKKFLVAILIAVCAEMCISTATGFDTIGNSSRSTYNENRVAVTKMAEYANEISGATAQDGDGSFGRSEVDDPVIHNCAALYHYRGLGQFASTLNENNTTLMEKIGLEANPGGNRFNYNQTNPVTNCITNIHYLIAKSKKIEDPDFKQIKKIKNTRLYESEYPLSIGYMLPQSIRTWNGESDNPFENLDAYVKAATDGKVESVFIDKGSGVINDEKTYSYYESEGVVQSSLLEATDTGTVSLNYTANSNDKYYVFVEATDADLIEIERENSIENIDIQSDCGSIINIGELKEGEEFKVKVCFDPMKAGRITCHVCTLDYDRWDKAYQQISKDQMLVTDCGDTFIKGEVNVSEEGVLVMSVPYEKGWKLKVDGKEREITELTGGSWISTQLSEGKHSIEISFLPPGLLIGCMASILSILALIVLEKLRKKKIVELCEIDEESVDSV